MRGRTDHDRTTFQSGSTQAIKNEVLVHGAFADDSSWSKVIPLLQAKGLHVTSVAIPLTSFADDVAATKRAIAAQDGPAVFAGHSYGGVVITEAGNDPKVASCLPKTIAPNFKKTRKTYLNYLGKTHEEVKDWPSQRIKNRETARQFLSFVKTAAIADRLRNYGFDVQDGSAK